jgi:FtsP/CotA-like multicopper oxidase with cupredoxin domain
MIPFGLFRASQLALLASTTLVACLATAAPPQPWGRGFDGHGSVKRFNLTLTWEKGAPDGFERNMFKINGQFPGPLLEMNEGDHVEILVVNKSPYATTIHYHGR